MGVNNKLNKLLKDEMDKVTKWEVNGKVVDLHFGWDGSRNCERVRKILENSKFFHVSQVHGWRLNWLKVVEVK